MGRPCPHPHPQQEHPAPPPPATHQPRPSRCRGCRCCPCSTCSPRGTCSGSRAGARASCLCICSTDRPARRAERPQGRTGSPCGGYGPILPEEGVFQIQEVTGFGARLVYLGHNTDVIALSAERTGQDGHELAGETDPCLPQPRVAAPTSCWQ